VTGEVTGRAWCLGDGIDTDVLAPGYAMKLPPEALAKHCLEAVRPSFAEEVRPGDVIVAGEGFGLGSSREQAAQSLKLLGVGAVLAKGFARIFYRNALNLGLPALFFPEADEIEDGAAVTVDWTEGRIKSEGRKWSVQPIPLFLAGMVRAGGLIPQLEARFGGGGR
jgi:3-isopropylmalate/(R)-2-methylmalate dehydratase small subunit